MSLESKPQKRTLLALLRDRRGAAYAEAVIVLPVLIAILWGNYLILGAGSSKLEAMNEVRRVAWDAANTPDLCEESDELDVSTDRFEGSGLVSSLFGVLDTITAIPIVGDFLEPFFDSFFGSPYSPPTSTREYDVPATFGGGTNTASADYMVMCNSKRQTISMLLADAFCSLIEGIVGSVPFFLSGMCS